MERYCSIVQYFCSMIQIAIPNGHIDAWKYEGVHSSFAFWKISPCMVRHDNFERPALLDYDGFFSKNSIQNILAV